MEASLSKSIRVGLFFVFGCVLIWITYETFSESNLYSEYGYPIEAPFEDLKQLKNGSDVRLAGVSIGAVTATRLEDGNAVAELSIEPDFLIPNDSVATITTAGLLGNNYVSIQLGDSESYLKSGDTIKTKESASINSVIAQVGEIGSKIEGFLSTLTEDGKLEFMENLNNLINEIRPQLKDSLSNISEFTNDLNRGEGSLAKLVHDDEFHDRIIAAADNIDSAAGEARLLFTDARDVIAKVDTQGGPLDFLLNDEEAADNLRSSVDNINEFSEKLNASNSTLGRLISDDSLYAQAEGILNKVEGAVESIENSGPITAVGVGAGALF